MAFSGDYIQPQRWNQFHFYATGKANGWETETLAPGVLFKLEEIRLHWSSVFLSVEDFIVEVSSVNGVRFSILLVSQALNGVLDLRVHYSNPLLFFSGDTIIFSASIDSNSIGYGLEVIGWGVKG